MNRNAKTALIAGGTVRGVIIILFIVSRGIYGLPYGGWGMMRPAMMCWFGWTDLVNPHFGDNFRGPDYMGNSCLCAQCQ
jgi:hypothetical protein